MYFTEKNKIEGAVKRLDVFNSPYLGRFCRLHLVFLIS